MDPCPDNSTECLLRAILNAQGYITSIRPRCNAFISISYQANNVRSDSKWDAASFGVTLAIGILALVVACLTIFQSVLAAGPGRLKASRNAIGPYSSLTRTEFSRSELRVFTTALVPLIELSGEGLRHDLPVNYRHFAVRDKPVRFGVKEVPRPLAAGWASLLDMFPRSFQASWSMFRIVRVSTDYIPTDVPATPVTSNIESMVLLAVLAGCDQVDIADGLPIAKGDHLLLSFREHTTLGLIAVCQVFETVKTYHVYGVSNQIQSKQ